MGKYETIQETRYRWAEQDTNDLIETVRLCSENKELRAKLLRYEKYAEITAKEGDKIDKENELLKLQVENLRGNNDKGTMEQEECNHDWIVITDENNFPEDVMCSKCKEVVIMVDMEKE